MDFARILHQWYIKNKRELPWRGTKDPYKVWLSEIILQQTRVEQGLPYYKEFVRKFPHVFALADATEDQVMKTWQGLGYYSRARNLHHTAKNIAKERAGKFPQNSEELMRLKGIGEYTAAAVSSICFGEAKAVVDGNVFRFLSRLFGIKTAIDSTKGKKIFRELANELLDKKNPGDHNQAVMEFGARQCVPKNPDCGNCPFVLYCVARKKNLISKLPVKSKKTKITDRFFYYFIFRNNNKIIIRKRTENDIWKNLYEFPLIETKKKVSEKKLFASEDWKKLVGKNKLDVKKISPQIKHVLSHQRLLVRFIEINSRKKLSLKNSIAVRQNEIDRYAFPAVIAVYLAS
ncbi:MAG: A/G-specific adenine glycosylase [Bacteroidetes bacterium]|nr:A/G-specific adenine glycosylase [Bacteroidota bacterium]